MNHVFLSSSSWYDEGIYKIEDDLFNVLWSHKPTEQQTIRVYGKEFKMPRYVQSYGIPYYFSGKMHEALPIPEDFQKIVDYANNYLASTSEWKDSVFNQMLVNWYENGEHYISAHADDEKSIVKGSPILSMSFGATRTFRIRNKKDKIRVCDITLNDGKVLVMCGDFQKDFTHEVPKTKKVKNARINITFRILNV